MHKHDTSDHRPSPVSPRGLLRRFQQFRLHPSDYPKVVEQFYVSLNTPVSLSCYILFKNGEFDQLVQKDINPLDYTDKVDFRDDFAAVSLLRKSKVVSTSFDKKKTALQAFYEGEENCKDVNSRIKGSNLISDLLKSEDWAVIHSQLRKIERILGEVDIEHILDRSSWGPGVTLSVKGDDTSSARKFDVECDITRDAYLLYGDVMKAAYPNWGNLHSPVFRIGNRVITVPKSAKTDRTIAIEPGLNVWIQLGLGRLVRKRLRSCGYDLNSDLKNQRQAYLGSIDDSVATLDFKAASDSIAKSLVEFLLPPRWFLCLDAARSHFYTLDGQNHCVSHKFSTMGNGFTFELESLIFLSLALAVCECQGVDDSSVSIFGDDLTLPPQCVPQFDRICKAYGFALNVTKSFSSGPFRESCGSYYFSGLDVKPFFFKNGLSNLKSVYRFANSISELAHRFAGRMARDGRFRGLWHLSIELVPKDLRLFGPLSAGDAVIHEDFSWKHARRCEDGWEGYFFSGYPAVVDEVEKESPGLLLARLHAPSVDRGYKNSVSLRGRVHIIFKKKMFTSQWYSSGPWLC